MFMKSLVNKTSISKKLAFVTLFFAVALVQNVTGQHGLKEHHYYSNYNESIHNLIPLKSGYKIAYAAQEKTEAPILRLLNAENLIIDSLNKEVYFHDIITLKNHILLTSISDSYLIPFTNSGFKEDSIKKAEVERGDFEKILIWKDKKFGWEENREGRKYIGSQLKHERKVLIEEIPKKIRNNKDNPTDIQRHLNQKQYYVNGQFAIVWFKSQKVYFLNPKTEEVSHYDFPENEDGVWYYFPDTAKGKHYLVKENNKNKFELYGFYLGSGVKKLFDLAHFPVAIYDESVLYKESDENDNQTHYLKPFKAYY
tara:strand:+ start:265555 stop:266487 length:933 start_codon:yes stop_codon:yes gene_type:complete